MLILIYIIDNMYLMCDIVNFALGCVQVKNLDICCLF